jgi:hypothetical protein
LALMRRNSGAIRTLVGTPVLDAGVSELMEDLEAAIARGEIPPLDADYVAGAMAGVGFEVAIRMVERRPPDVEGAAAFATDLFLGGIARMSR